MYLGFIICKASKLVTLERPTEARACLLAMAKPHAELHGPGLRFDSGLLQQRVCKFEASTTPMAGCAALQLHTLWSPSTPCPSSEGLVNTEVPSSGGCAVDVNVANSAQASAVLLNMPLFGGDAVGASSRTGHGSSKRHVHTDLVLVAAAPHLNFKKTVSGSDSMATTSAHYAFFH